MQQVKKQINYSLDEQGFSLLELMVSIAITGIVFAGVMSSMNSLSSKTSSNSIDLQLKAQMAFSHIGDAFKEAGASVCDNLMRGLILEKRQGSSGFLTVSSLIDDANGSALFPPTARAVDGLGFPITTQNISAGSFVNDGMGSLTDSNFFPAASRAPNRVASSDMINTVSTGEKATVLSYITPGMTSTQRMNARTVGPITISNRPSNIPISSVYNNTTAALAAPVNDWYAFVITNCGTPLRSEIFEATLSETNSSGYPNPDPRVDLNFIAGGITMSDPDSIDGMLEVAALRSETYFINNVPPPGVGFSLSRFYGFNDNGARSLVAGVEMMNVQWGVDVDADPDFEVDIFIESDNISGDNLINSSFSYTWDQVVAVRVDLIIGDPDATGNVDSTYTLNYPRGSNQTVTYTRGQDPVIRIAALPQALPSDYVGVGHYARQVFSKTFTLRNKVGL